MLLHKGGQINNVQLITGGRIVEMSQLQNCSVMCAKKEVIVKIKKVRGEGSEEMCTKNGRYCREKDKKVGGGGGQGECERRSEAFVKIQKKKIRGAGRVGLGGGGRM